MIFTRHDGKYTKVDLHPEWYYSVSLKTNAKSYGYPKSWEQLRKAYADVKVWTYIGPKELTGWTDSG